MVDDSALMRKVISDMINEQSDMEVIAVARNGEELLNKIQKEEPDVITLDVEMPKMDGITALKELKKQKSSIPVIMLSSASTRGTELTIECLELGAFDFVRKPSGAISLDITKVKNELIERTRMAYEKYKNGVKTKINEKEVENIKTISRQPIRSRQIDAVVIGASTGGPKALYAVLTKLPKNLGVPVFVVQHMPVGFTKAFAERLNENCQLKVTEASHREIIEKNTIYIAPGGQHMEVGRDGKICLNDEPAIWGVRPAVDKLFISASEVYGANIVSVILTGMGRDGAQGTIAIKNAGGVTISEDKSTCTIYGMPKAAYETGKVDLVLPVDEVSNEVIKLVSNRR